MDGLSLARPCPPASVLNSDDPDAPSGIFLPAPDLVEWARASFLEEGSPLFNADHEHLAEARIGALWTDVPNRRKQKWVLGTAEVPMPPPASGAWARGRWLAQMGAWFGEVPDFLLTFYAPGCVALDDASFCALVDHELYHCGQATDRDTGEPLFHRDSGLPKYAILGHDFEGFLGITRRYGPGSAEAGVAELVALAGREPEIAAAQIVEACGTCR